MAVAAPCYGCGQSTLWLQCTAPSAPRHPLAMRAWLAPGSVWWACKGTRGAGKRVVFGAAADGKATRNSPVNAVDVAQDDRPAGGDNPQLFTTGALLLPSWRAGAWAGSTPVDTGLTRKPGCPVPWEEPGEARHRERGGCALCWDLGRVSIGKLRRNFTPT